MLGLHAYSGELSVSVDVVLHSLRSTSPLLGVRGAGGGGAHGCAAKLHLVKVVRVKSCNSAPPTLQMIIGGPQLRPLLHLTSDSVPPTSCLSVRWTKLKMVVQLIVS